VGSDSAFNKKVTGETMSMRGILFRLDNVPSDIVAVLDDVVVFPHPFLCRCAEGEKIFKPNSP